MSVVPEMSDVFRFTELRAPYSPDVKALRQHYIRDDYVDFRGETPCRIDADLQSANSHSAIGRLIFEQVFCSDIKVSNQLAIEGLTEAVLHLLTAHVLPCHDDDGRERITVSLFDLERSAHLKIDDAYYLLPERLEQIPELPLLQQIEQALDVMARASFDFNLKQLISDLETIFDGRTLYEVVYQNGVYTEEFRAVKRALFDTLYLLYVLRRRTSVKLEHVIDGLRVLHVIEALAIDDWFSKLKRKGSSLLPRLVAVVRDFLRRILGSREKVLSTSRGDALFSGLASLFPELVLWNRSDFLPSLPLIQTKADFDAYFKATPIIHPIFARLFQYKQPFNNLTPIGIGDLKVVKQWLVAYLPGEIAHVENVLKGEIKDRTHRRLEKTEEAFSFSSEYSEEAQKDLQTTDRFELKQEAENILKTEMGYGANASATYKQDQIFVASLGANLSSKRDMSEQSKTAATLVRETLAKAVNRVQKRTAEQRSVTKIFETEETNKHGIDNTKGSGHITGIYRWLDKKYKAQVFNYGRRMMFEFIVPEPAAFFIESRLQSFVANVNVPQPPKKPVDSALNLGFSPENINEVKFNELKKTYDLSEFSYPLPDKTMYLTDAGNNISFSQKDLPDRQWSVQAFQMKTDLKGYQITRVELGGSLEFHNRNRTAPEEINLQQVELQGIAIGQRDLNRVGGWNYDFPEDEERIYDLTANPIVITTEDISAKVRFQAIRHIKNLTLRLALQPSAAFIANWQNDVYRKVLDIEKKKVDKENQEAKLAYDTKMATYRNRIAELKAATVNDLLQGQSEAFNREFIVRELKKHCLTMLTKEFDTVKGDDIVSEIKAMGSVKDTFAFHQFNVTENITANNQSTTFTAETEEINIEYPAIDLEKAKEKGRYIQFLEQAFEWQQLAYIFYPYFWADRPKWIEIMNHVDETDPNMSAFLQAGSVKVLIAATPRYEDAILHYLATREPWDGGPSPVIGDPLFIPLHEEVRKRQDDLYNATPEGEPWTFTLPTSLVYLDGGGATLPTFEDRTSSSS